MIGETLARAFDAALVRDDQPHCPAGQSTGGRFTNDDGQGCDGGSPISPPSGLALKHFGLRGDDPAVARDAVTKLLADFESAKQYDARIETAFAVDPQTGREIITKRGTENAVQFDPDEVKKLVGAIFTHNHPSGSSFSIPDMAMFLAHGMREMRAFGRGNDGKLYHYRVTRTGAARTREWREWIGDANEISEGLFAKWRPEVAAGKRTVEAAEREHWHVVWDEFFGASADFEYERREVGKGEKRGRARRRGADAPTIGEQADGGWIIDGPGSEADYSTPGPGPAKRGDDQPRCPKGDTGGGRYSNDAGDGCEGASSGGDDRAAIRDGAAKGRGTVQIGANLSGVSAAEVEKLTRGALDHLGLTLDDIGDLFAPAGSEVTVYSLKNADDQVFVAVRGDKYNATRAIVRDDEGVRIYNSTFSVWEGHRGQGVGASVLAREVDAAIKLGIKTIATTAVGDADGPSNGYYTWPRLGFDGRFDEQEYLNVAIRKGAADKGWERLSDAMRTPEGRKWWQDIGDDVHVEFDLSEGSLSRRVFAAYLRERAKRAAKRARIEAWLRDQPRCSEIEEGKPGRFTNEDGQGCDGAEGSKAKGEESAKADAPPEVRFRTNVTPREFIDARNATTRPGFLSPLAEADLAGKTLVLSTDGKVGYMLAPDGYAGNLFNNGGPKGAGKAALVDAIERGAGYLDCFDGFLPDLYHDYGFVETGRLKFVDEYAPTGWDFGRYGRPDVVFMAYRGGDRKTIKDRVGTFGEHRKPAELVDDYDAALDRAREVSRGADRAERRGVGREAQGAARRAGRLHRQPLARDDQPRCSDLEEGKPGRFTNAEGQGCDGAEGKAPKLDANGLDGDDVAPDDGEHGEVQYELGMPKQLVGYGFKLPDITALVPSGAKATVSYPFEDYERRTRGFQIQMVGDQWHATRVVTLGDKEWPGSIANEVMQVRAGAQRAGTGTELLRREIEFANKYGIPKITTYAAKAGDTVVGYKVWPLLGFNGPISDALRPGLAAKIEKFLPAAKGVKTLLDLYAVPGGREFWADHGDALSVAFDPREGSRSRRVFDAYLEARRKRAAKRSRLAQWLRSDQPRCSELEEGSTGQYTNAAGDGCDGTKGAGEKKGVKDYAAKGKGTLPPDVGALRSEADRLLGQMGVKPDDIMDLFGPEGSEVTYGVDVSTSDPEGRGGAIWTKTVIHRDDLKVEAWRRIEKNGSGELILTNLDLHVEPSGTGYGTAFLAREIAAAERLGIKRIVVDTAAGSATSKSYNGYYTWPLLGFDIPIAKMMKGLVYHELVERFPDAQSLSDLMMTREGREWWKEKGSTLLGVEFDVTPGSRSRKVFEAYLERRFGGKDATRAWLRALAILLRSDDQPRCSDLEEGKPGRFTNEEGQGCDGAEGGAKAASAEAKIGPGHASYWAPEGGFTSSAVDDVQEAMRDEPVERGAAWDRDGVFVGSYSSNDANHVETPHEALGLDGGTRIHNHPPRDGGSSGPSPGDVDHAAWSRLGEMRVVGSLDGKPITYVMRGFDKLSGDVSEASKVGEKLAARLRALVDANDRTVGRAFSRGRWGDDPSYGFGFALRVHHALRDLASEHGLEYRALWTGRLGSLDKQGTLDDALKLAGL